MMPMKNKNKGERFLLVKCAVMRDAQGKPRMEESAQVTGHEALVENATMIDATTMRRTKKSVGSMGENVLSKYAAVSDA